MTREYLEAILLAVALALLHKQKTGEGQHVDVALLDAMLFQSTGYLTLGAMGADLPRLGNSFRFIDFERRRFSFWHRTESAGTRTDVATDHEGRCLLTPAF